MNEEQVIAINYTKNIFFFFLFPFFYGFVVSICLTFGWITSIMLGYKLKSHIFYQSGIFTRLILDSIRANAPSFLS